MTKRKRSGTGTPAAAARPRRYSKDFTPDPDARRQLAFDVPLSLHTAVRRKAKAAGVSVRSLVLSYLQEWAAAS